MSETEESKGIILEPEVEFVDRLGLGKTAADLMDVLVSAYKSGAVIVVGFFPPGKPPVFYTADHPQGQVPR